MSFLKRSAGKSGFKPLIVLGILALMSACATAPEPKPVPPVSKVTVPSTPWLLVDTKADTLSIMRGEKPVQVFRGIALGSRGAGFKRRQGDNTTPLGVFRVGWVNDHSRFRKFIGIDYPNMDYAQRALNEKRIDSLTYQRIRMAWLSGRTPPQNTPLGGQIGIHGVGRGDPLVHEAGFNWTSGCVALSNQQIDILRARVAPGMRVEIR